MVAQKNDIVGFNLFLGGRVGVQAKDTGLFVKSNEVKKVFEAVIYLFKRYGFRDNRNKNRLHFLLEAVGMEAFVEAIKEQSGLMLEKSGESMVTQELVLDESGVLEV